MGIEFFGYSIWGQDIYTNISSFFKGWFYIDNSFYVFLLSYGLALLVLVGIGYRYVVNRDFSKDMDKFKENGKTDQDILKFSNNIKTCIDAHITIAKIHKKDDEKWTRKLIKMRNNEFFMYEPNIKEQIE